MQGTPSQGTEQKRMQRIASFQKLADCYLLMPVQFPMNKVQSQDRHLYLPLDHLAMSTGRHHSRCLAARRMNQLCEHQDEMFIKWKLSFPR